MHLEWYWVISRNHEIWPRDDVSAHQIHVPGAVLLCWRTMLMHININDINTWCDALSSRWVVGARLPKCPCVTFPFLILDFDMFSWIIMSSYGFSHQSITLGNQNSMSGVRGSYWSVYISESACIKRGARISTWRNDGFESSQNQY